MTDDWNENQWAEAAKRIKKELGFNVHNLPGCLQIDLNDVRTFANLQRISEICGGTKNIDFNHEPASGSEWTPEGDYADVNVWKSVLEMGLDR